MKKSKYSPPEIYRLGCMYNFTGACGLAGGLFKKIAEVTMARNRMIKPEFFTDDDLCSICIEASHLFSGIWCFSDDYGAIDFSERSIMGDIYRKRTSIKWRKVQIWIQDLINIGALIKCSYVGRDYLVVTNWDEHQTINRPSARTCLDKSTTYKVRLMYKDMSDSGQTSCEAPEFFLSVSLMKENKNKNKNKNKKENKKCDSESSFPNLEEVKEFFVTNGYSASLAEQFYNGYNINNWIDSKGNPVKNWKQKAIHVWFRPEQKQSTSEDSTSRIFREVTGGTN